MAQEQLQKTFDSSTQMYCQDNYPACLSLLNDCIEINPTLSILYSNRAVANFHLRQNKKSLQDLQTAVKMNQLDYVARFNMFSIMFLNDQIEQAYEQLCLSLSGAYFALGMKLSQISWLRKAIQYGHNNKEALALLGLMEIDSKQHQQAYQHILKAYKLQHRPKIAQKIKGFLIKLQNTDQNLNKVSSDSSLICATEPYVLKTRFICPIEEHIRERAIQGLMTQFNMIYRTITSKHGAKISRKSTQYNGSTSNVSLMNDQKELKSQSTNIIGHNDSSQIRDLPSKPCSTDLDLISNYDIKESNKDCSIIEKQFQKECSAVDSQVSYKLNDQQQKIRFLMECVYLLPEVAHLSNLYAVITYNQHMHRTALGQVNNGQCSWQQPSQFVALSLKPTLVKLRVLQRNITAFQDNLVGECEFQLMATGQQQVKLWDREAPRGVFWLTIEPQF